MAPGPQTRKYAEALGMLTAAQFAAKMGLTQQQVNHLTHTCQIKRPNGSPGYIRLDKTSGTAIRLFYCDAIVIHKCN